MKGGPSTQKAGKIEKNRESVYDEAFVVDLRRTRQNQNITEFLASLERVVELAHICGAKFIPYENSPPSGTRSRSEDLEAMTRLDSPTPTKALRALGAHT